MTNCLVNFSIKNHPSNFKDLLEEGEEIIWEKSPSLLMLDTGDILKFDPERFFNFLRFAFRFEIIISVVFIPLILAYLVFYVLPLEWKIVVSILFIMVATMKFLRIKKSKYAYSNKRVFISIWNWGKQKTNTFYLDEIGNITTEVYPNGGGLIHFMPNQPLGFKGKALLSGMTRHYPTIEFVNDILRIAEDIKSTRTKMIAKKRKR